MNNDKSNKNKQVAKIDELSPKQKSIYQDWLNPKIKYLILSCGRQVGKSYVAIAIAIKTALNPHLLKADSTKCKIAFFMPFNDGAKLQYERAVEFIQGKLSGLKLNSTSRTIKFPNGSVIRFFGAEKQTSIRGNTFDYIIVDEACFVRDEVWQAGITPTISRAMAQGYGKVLLASTPKEKNWFYDYFNNTSEGFKSIKFTSYESGLPGDNIAEVDRQKQLLPKAIFENEYMAEFIDGSRGMFELERITFAKQNAISDKQGVIAGIDWGFTNDYTVLVILNTNKEVCYINRWKNVGTHELIPQITNALKAHGNPFVYAETNGIGSFPTDDLKRVYGAVKGFTTTQSNKTEMIMKLANHLLTLKEEDKLKLPDVEYLKEEFENFGFRYENGGMKFGNMKADIHDDTVMATAIANYHFERFSLSF